MLRRVLVALALLMISDSARAAELDLQRWLDEPDVKLVVVEFYADWCEPCREAAPKWEALRQKYAPQGLKLVVVNLSEQSGRQGRCSRLPWNPDESLCDPGLGEQFGVTSLPEAFVWSWQGNLLVERGQHVAEIEPIIRRYLDDNPRVQVVATKRNGSPAKALQRQVEGVLSRAGKLTVVPDAEMRTRLARVRRDSHRASKRDDQRCALGAEISANSLLSVERFEGALSLTLADAESGCQRATATVPLRAGRVEKAVDKAAYKLMLQLKQRVVAMPRQASSPPSASPRSEAPSESLVHVMFTSDPSGAAVLLGGQNVCEATPCKSKVRPGRHQIRMRLDGYTPLERDVMLDSGQIVGWSLEREVPAKVWFVSAPPGARVMLEGKEVCKSTPCRHTIATGTYRVLMTLDHHLSVDRVVALKDGQSVGWTLPIDPQASLLTVYSTPAGQPVELDGTMIGVAPLGPMLVSKGEHFVTVGLGDCRVTKLVNFAGGAKKVIDVPVKGGWAHLHITARDARPWLSARERVGTVSAEVFIDGQNFGVTSRDGSEFRVSTCARKVLVRHPKFGEWEGEIALGRGEKKALEVKLKGAD